MAQEQIHELRCSFCGKDLYEVRKIIAGPKVFIGDQCVDLCIDIIAEESRSPLEEATPAPIGTTAGEPLVREVVGNYADSNVGADFTMTGEGIDRICEGCGWRLRLKRSAKPSVEHSEQVLLGLLGGPIPELSRTDLVPRCPNPEWKKLP